MRRTGQVDLRKHHYKQSQWRWWNSSWAISNPERWCCESAALNIAANLENSALTTRLEKSVFIPIPKKGNAKECSSYRIIALISHASKVMLKILQARLQLWNFMNCEIPNVQAGFRKGRGTRDQVANIHWIIKNSKKFCIYKKERNQKSNCQHLLDHRTSKRVPEKHLPQLYWLHQRLWLCGSQQTLENSSRDENTRSPDLPPEKSAFRSRSNS